MTAQTQPIEQLLKQLQRPSPSTCRVESIDFRANHFSEHENTFAILIHDLLSPAECDQLQAAAESTTQGRWDPALVRVGNHDVLATEMRLCDRIIWDESTVVAALLHRIRPHLPADVTTLQDRTEMTGGYPEWSCAKWQITRLNERLRFLRYTPGMYFRQHTDAHFETDDGKETSFLTVHIYLRSSQDLEGGATRFFGMDEPGSIREIDVDPAPGSCLIFQQYDLVHSGEDVRRGTKYTVRTDVMYQKVPA